MESDDDDDDSSTPSIIEDDDPMDLDFDGGNIMPDSVSSSDSNNDDEVYVVNEIEATPEIIISSDDDDDEVAENNFQPEKNPTVEPEVTEKSVSEDKSSEKPLQEEPPKEIENSQKKEEETKQKQQVDLNKLRQHLINKFSRTGSSTKESKEPKGESTRNGFAPLSFSEDSTSSTTSIQLDPQPEPKITDRFTCSFPSCRTTFFTRAQLDTHLLLHSGMWSLLFNCSSCGKSFVKQFQLDRHTATRHKVEKNPQFRCTKCDFTAITKEAVKLHIQTRHFHLPKAVASGNNGLLLELELDFGADRNVDEFIREISQN